MTGAWNDPREFRAEDWSGSNGPERRGEAVRSVPERAEETAAPYRRRGTETRSGPALAALFQSREYRYARVDYDATLLAGGAVKVLVKGHLWGSDDRDQRYRIQHRRAAAPTDSVPFDDYDTWVRYQFGDVEGSPGVDDGDPVFQATTEPADENRTLAWTDLFPLHRRLLAELELARNAAFAEYRLRELDEWADVAGDLKWDLAAFAVGP